MLALNNITRRLFNQTEALTLKEYANQMSVDSIQRYCEYMSKLYKHAGAKVEYDGKILRCVLSDTDNLQEKFEQFESELVEISPLNNGMASFMQTEISGNTMWWFDLQSLQERYQDRKDKVLSLVTANEKKLLELVPVVIGGDWEFNAWACPALENNSFIMVNRGFINSYDYEAMFLDVMDEIQQNSEYSKASGLIASSMIWQAAQTLGYEARQYHNLMLPPSEYNRIWNNVQHPSRKLKYIMDFIDAFVMLHECGHIALGHIAELQKWLKKKEINCKEELHRYGLIRDFELEADRFACKSLSQLYPDGSSFEQPLMILFSMLLLCEDHSKPNFVSTHPSAKLRFYKCLESLGQDPEKGCYILDKFIALFFHTSSNRLKWQESNN